MPLDATTIRRTAIAAAPVLGGIGCFVGAIADPEPSARASELITIYADNWDAVQLKSSAYHYGYMFVAAAALGIAGLVRRGRGSVLALVAGALAVLGICTLPGMLIADFYASAGGQIVGTETMREIEVASQGGAGATAIVLPGMLGFLLCLPLATIAAIRAGLLRWWALASVVVALGCFAAGAATPLGNGLMTIAFLPLAWGVLRSGDRATTAVDQPLVVEGMLEERELATA